MVARTENQYEPTLHSSLGRVSKFVVGALFLLHMAGVAAEPFRMFTQSEFQSDAPDSGLLRTVYSPYVEFLFLNHGYFFFAPNPGPAHLLECEISLPDSTENSASTRILTLPDRSEQFPRLYYHRHFMLSEFYNNMFALPISEMPPEIADDEQLASSWRYSRDAYDDIRSSIRNHILFRFPDATRVNLRRVEHNLPTVYDFHVDGIQLQDSRLYVVLPESTSVPELESQPLPMIDAVDNPIESLRSLDQLSPPVESLQSVENK